MTLLARVRTLACKWLSRRPLGHPSSLSSRRPCPWEEEEEAHTTLPLPAGKLSFVSAAAAVATHRHVSTTLSRPGASLLQQPPCLDRLRPTALHGPRQAPTPRAASSQKTGHDDQVRGLQVGGPLARADVEHVAGLPGFHCPSFLPWAYHAPWGWGLGSDTLSAAATSLDRGSVALQAIHFFSQSATCFPPQGRSSCPRTCSSSWSTTTRRGP